MPNNNSPDPTSLLNFAREYQRAAEELFFSKSHVKNVTYFLYFHTTELLLKAYLGAKGTNSWGHKLSDLYSECLNLGLRVAPKDQVGLENVVSLLESGNEDMGFRYFSAESVTVPTLEWTREVVSDLLQVVAAVVEPNGVPAPVTGFKLTQIIGKPVPNQ